MTAPKIKMLAHNGGLPSGNYPAADLVRYIRADAPELLALLDTARAVDHDNTHGNGFEGFRKNRQRLRIALEQWEALQ